MPRKKKKEETEETEEIKEAIIHEEPDMDESNDEEESDDLEDEGEDEDEPSQSEAEDEFIARLVEEKREIEEKISKHQNKEKQEKFIDDAPKRLEIIEKNIVFLRKENDIRKQEVQDLRENFKVFLES